MEEIESTQTATSPTDRPPRPLALRQPEVFETPDVVDTGPIVVVEEERKNEDIDRTGISPNKAFARFFDKSYDPLQELSVSSRRSARQTEFEVSKEDLRPLKETPLQRFQRLQSEVRELSEELSAAAEKRIPLEQNIPALAVADEVQQLQIQLEALIAKEENRPFLNLNYENEQASILQASLSKKLVSHLEALAAKGKKKSGQKPSEGSGQITYELFCSPEIAKSIKEGNEVAMIAEMDKRISQLEKLLGTNTFKGNMPRADLFSLIEILNDKLALLNPEELDKVDRRLKMLSTELDELARSEEATALPAHQEKKVNELYEIMSRADVTIQQIPAIIARLQSLRPLYDESLTFSQTLRHLHQQQSQIFQMLTSHNSHLIKVEDGLAENISIIQKNINSLGTRLEKVSEKLSSSSPS